MTAPVLKIKVLAKPIVKGKMDVRFPARVQVVSPILLDNTGGVYTFSMDMNAIIATLGAVFQPIENIDQEITAGSAANVDVNSNTVRVNKSVGGNITLTLPPANTKISAVLIADWKGDAGTNNITIVPTGSEKIQGLSSWIIAADNGSVFLRPIPGKGYAL
ncbi:hypothetical protein KUL72_20750 [Bradyrhizobium arachidis]|uniref:hypothetical protein n=1 Tax=Bradyrhizobium arachidis TaxID=858423 RepID=UPI0021615C3C|nr:hypothetical protein [Bradyrhizobium arachidis]UVO33946.1 hypothetical protein KUL72_20750 [Bradyrhizobium arachidis]